MQNYVHIWTSWCNTSATKHICIQSVILLSLKQADGPINQRCTTSVAKNRICLGQPNAALFPLKNSIFIFFYKLWESMIWLHTTFQIKVHWQTQRLKIKPKTMTLITFKTWTVPCNCFSCVSKTGICSRRKILPNWRPWQDTNPVHPFSPENLLTSSTVSLPLVPSCCSLSFNPNS